MSSAGRQGFTLGGACWQLAEAIAAFKGSTDQMGGAGNRILCAATALSQIRRFSRYDSQALHVPLVLQLCRL